MSQESKPQTCLTNESLNINISNLYPTNRSNYCFYTGELGENVITNVIRDILPNIDIPYHRVTVNGSDIRIFYDGKLIGKFEVLNLDSKSYINSKRALSIKQNLKGVKYKGVICSFFNATSRAKEILKNIPICTIGFQLLPSKFHQYYAMLNKVHHRRIASIRSLKMLKNTLKSFFCRIGLNLLMYASRSRISISDTINLKNTNLSIDVKNIETENKRARTEEKTESSTPREDSVSTTSVGTETRRLKLKEISFDSKEISPNLGKISTVSIKIRAFYNRLRTSVLNLLFKLWDDKCGSVTLANWIPIKLKNKNGRARRRKMFPCAFRVVVVCPYHSQFYACFLLVFYEYVKRLLKYGCYDEDKIYSRAKCYLLHKMWIYKNHILAKCKCKPKSIIDNEIVDRQFRSPLSSFEPCKNYRCTFMINKKICPYLIAIEKSSIKPKQLNLSAFMNGGLS